jgi:hypothetical protein
MHLVRIAVQPTTSGVISGGSGMPKAKRGRAIRRADALSIQDGVFVDATTGQVDPTTLGLRSVGDILMSLDQALTIREKELSELHQTRSFFRDIAVTKGRGLTLEELDNEALQRVLSLFLVMPCLREDQNSGRLELVDQ